MSENNLENYADLIIITHEKIMQYIKRKFKTPQIKSKSSLKGKTAVKSLKIRNKTTSQLINQSFSCLELPYSVPPHPRPHMHACSAWRGQKRASDLSRGSRVR